MIILIYSFIFIASIIWSKFKYKKFLSVETIFTFIWCFFASLSSLGVAGMRIPSFTIHIYSWIFVCTFDVISFVVSPKPRAQETIKSKEAVVFNGGILSATSFLEISSLALLLVTFVKILAFYSGESASLVLVRTFYYSGEIFSNQYLDLIFRAIPTGFLSSLIIVYIYQFIYCHKKSSIFIAAFNVLILTIASGGGRYSFLTFVFSIIVFLFLAPGNKTKVSTGMKRVLVCALIIAILLVVGITSLRGQSFVDSFIKYYSGSLSFLDRILASPTDFGLDSKTYGYLSFGFICEPFVLFLKVLGLTSAKTPGHEFNIYCQEFYNIGVDSPVYFNNNTSVLYYYLRDFGPIGIVIGALLFSFLIIKTRQKYESSPIYRFMFAFACICLFNSIMTYQFFGMNVLYGFVVFLVCGSDICTLKSTDTVPNKTINRRTSLL